MEITQAIKEEMKKVFADLGGEIKDEEIVLQKSDNRGHGDYASNLALRKAKSMGLKPIELANKIVENFYLEGVDHVEAVMPGFLNFFLKQMLKGKLKDGSTIRMKLVAPAEK